MNFFGNQVKQETPSCLFFSVSLSFTLCLWVLGGASWGSRYQPGQEQTEPEGALMEKAAAEARRVIVSSGKIFCF